jgi:hypothetical protein
MSGKLYVGVLNGGGREVFRSASTPTERSHGRKYRYAIGPFRTLAGADLAVSQPAAYASSDDYDRHAVPPLVKERHPPMFPRPHKKNPALRNVRKVGNNMTEAEHGDITVLWSYETPVALLAPSGFYRSSTMHSVTTAKHIAAWGRHHGLDMKGASRIDQEDLVRAVEEGIDPERVLAQHLSAEVFGGKRRRNPGKFDDSVEELLYVIDHDQTAGDANEGGWYGLVSGLLRPEAIELAELNGLDIAEFQEDAKQYDWPLNAIITEDSQGFVEVFTFKENRDLIASWRKVERDFG